MSGVTAIDTTTFHNEVYRTFQPSLGASVMSAVSELEPRSNKYEMPNGYDVFHWPEFQALARRLSIDLGAPVIDVTINVPVEGLVTITTETRGLDETKKR